MTSWTCPETSSMSIHKKHNSEKCYLKFPFNFFFIKPIFSVHLRNASQRWEQNVLHYISVLHVAEHCCNMQGLYKLSTSLNNPKFLKRAHHLSWSRSETRGASSSSDPWKTCCQNPLREWRHHILRTRPHKVWTQPILQRHQIII